MNSKVANLYRVQVDQIAETLTQWRFKNRKQQQLHRLLLPKCCKGHWVHDGELLQLTSNLESFYFLSLAAPKFHWLDLHHKLTAEHWAVHCGAVHCPVWTDVLASLLDSSARATVPWWTVPQGFTVVRCTQHTRCVCFRAQSVCLKN